MSLRFIIGRAGAGKTTCCLNEIKNELLDDPRGSSLILLVPEQGTFEMEKSLVCMPGIDGSIRASVLSFRRLAWRVLTEVGGAARPHLQETGRRMIIRKLLEQHRDQLRVFNRSASQPGFADKLALAIGEIKAYCILPEQLKESAESINQSNPLLADKLKDLSMIYQAFEKSLDGRFTDPDDYLILAANSLPESKAIKGAKVWIDGFTDFTPQEMKVIKALLSSCQQVNVILCLDQDVLRSPVDQQDIFYRSHRTYLRLADIAGELGIVTEKMVLLQEPDRSRFVGHPSLAHLEKHFFERPRRILTGEIQDIKLVGAHNRRAEVEGAARAIIELVRDNGYHWRDIAIMVRDLSHYEDIFKQVFEAYEIPCFIDYKRPVMNHPLIELILSSLAVINSRWSYAPVFRYLKTDFIYDQDNPAHRISEFRQDIDELENYVVAHSIRGSRWTDDRPWEYRRFYSIGEDQEISEYQADQLVRINHIRKWASGGLAQFEGRVKTNPSVRGICEALYLLMTDLEVPNTLGIWAEETRQSGDLDMSREHTQIYDQVLALLDDMVEAFDEEIIPMDVFIKILESGCESLRLGLIPPGMDQVFLGSLDRSRNPMTRAGFLLGVNDGLLPGRQSGHGIFTDIERNQLSDEGMELAPDQKHNLFHEKFLVYQGLTRAGEYLWISYALADQQGNTLNPSILISDIKELFPDLKEIICTLEPAGDAHDIDFVARPGPSLSSLVARLRRVRSGLEDMMMWGDVYNWLKINDSDRLHTLMGLFYSNQEDVISKTATRNLYGNSLRVSVTQIEKYISCPFSHFIQFGLRVRERDTGKVRPLDMGQFFHAALKMLVERFEAVGWEKITADRCSEILDEIMAHLVPQLQNEIILDSERQKYLVGKLRQIILKSALAIVDHMCAGYFRPIGLEIPFGYPDSMKGQEFILEDGTSLALAGKIDRIDIFNNDQEQYIRLIDYKSGSAALDLNDLYYGLRIQLLTYLDAILANEDELADIRSVPAAMLYFHIQNPMVSTDGAMEPQEIARKLRKSFQLKGLVLGEQEVVDWMENGISGSSDILPVALNQDGEFRASSAIASRQQFEALRQHLQFLMLDAGARMTKGEVPISPYRRNKKRACTYCRYKPICRFEQIANNQYRDLKSNTPEFIWRDLEKGVDSH